MDFLNSLNSIPFSSILFFLKIILGGISFLLLAFVVFTFTRSSWFKMLVIEDFTEFMTYRPFGVKKLLKIWNKINGRLDTGLESEYKLAVVEADNLMDDILKRMGYKGETLSERLGSLTAATLHNIEDIKDAHKLRNNIVHEPDYTLSLDDAKHLLDIYEKALRNLDAF